VVLQNFRELWNTNLHLWVKIQLEPLCGQHLPDSESPDLYTNSSASSKASRQTCLSAHWSLSPLSLPTSSSAFQLFDPGAGRLDASRCWFLLYSDSRALICFIDGYFKGLQKKWFRNCFRYAVSHSNPRRRLVGVGFFGHDGRDRGHSSFSCR